MEEGGLEIEVVNLDGGTLLRVRGEVDMATAGELRDAVLAQATGGDTVVLDLAGVTFMDSCGLHVLLEHHRAAGADCVIQVVDPSGPVRQLFRHAGVESILFPDVVD